MQVKPIDQAVLEAVYPVAVNYYVALEQEQAEHKKTLALLQAIKRGEVDIADVAVTDDGWRMIPPEPKGETHDSSSNGAVPAHVG